MLTDEQRQEFDLNGFLIIADALTAAEVSRYLSVVDRLDRACPTAHGDKAR